MRREGVRILVVILLALSAVPSRARTPSGGTPTELSAEPYPVLVEVDVSAAGRTMTAATAAAVAEGKKKAVREFIAAVVPAGRLAGREAEVEELLSHADLYIISYEIRTSRQENEKLHLELRVNLDPERLGSELKRRGFLPPRTLPAVFIVVRGRVGEKEVKSGWERPPGAPGEFNACEAQLAREFEAYGFKVLRPGADAPAANVSQILMPGGPEEKAAVFRLLRDRFQAGVLVVGLLSSDSVEARSAGRKWRITLKLAAADAGKEKTVISEENAEVFGISNESTRQAALERLCTWPGEKVVEALFQEFSLAPPAGEPREISLIITGLTSYLQLKEIERKLKEEGPGVQAVGLTRLSPGRIELMVVASADAETLAQWFTTNQFSNLRFTGRVKDDTHVEAQAETPPGGSAPAEGSTVSPQPASTASPNSGSTTAPASGSTPSSLPPRRRPPGAEPDLFLEGSPSSGSGGGTSSSRPE